VARVREQVSIAVPPERVWRAVHEDLAEVPRWAHYVRRVVLLDGDRPGPGRRVRYDLDLPGDWSLTLLPAEWERPHRCSGRFAGGPVEGTWSYAYTEGDGQTSLVYETDYRVGGLLRFARALVQSRYEEGVREGMARLKEYLEAEATA
jgi:uncharacterized protein YndB with AHSA1/START domain